jgi:peptidoglycan/LPS O-acetylase OafA/YrhL
LVALCAASAAGSSHWLAVGDLAWLSLARFLHFFLLGFLLADVYLLDWRERPAQTLAWDLAPLLGWPLLYWLWERFPPPGPGGHEPLPTALVFPLVAFLLNVAAFRGRFTNRLLTLPWITALGGMCYSIYLWHNPLFGGLIALTGGRPLLDAGWTARVSVQGLLVLAPTLALCAVYFVLVEKPCMRRDWPQRLRARLFGAARSA